MSRRSTCSTMTSSSTAATVVASGSAAGRGGVGEQTTAAEVALLKQQLQEAQDTIAGLEESYQLLGNIVHEEHVIMDRLKQLGGRDPELHYRSWELPGPLELLSPKAARFKQRERAAWSQDAVDYQVMTDSKDWQHALDDLRWPRGNRPDRKMTLPSPCLEEECGSQSGQAGYPASIAATSIGGAGRAVRRAGARQIVQHFESPTTACKSVILGLVPQDDPRVGLRGQRCVLASRPIRAGTVLHGYRALVCRTSELEQYHPRYSGALWRRMIMSHPNSDDAQDPLVTSAWPNGNFTQYINDCRSNPYHSNDTEAPPNCIFYTVSDRGWETTYVMAVYDIPQAQELTVSYGSNYWPNVMEHSYVMCLRLHHLPDLWSPPTAPDSTLASLPSSHSGLDSDHDLALASKTSKSSDKQQSRKSKDQRAAARSSAAMQEEEDYRALYADEVLDESGDESWSESESKSSASRKPHGRKRQKSSKLPGMEVAISLFDTVLDQQRRQQQQDRQWPVVSLAEQFQQSARLVVFASNAVKECLGLLEDDALQDKHLLHARLRQCVQGELDTLNTMETIETMETMGVMNRISATSSSSSLSL